MAGPGGAGAGRRPALSPALRREAFEPQTAPKDRKGQEDQLGALVLVVKGLYESWNRNWHEAQKCREILLELPFSQERPCHLPRRIAEIGAQSEACDVVEIVALP